MMLKSSIGLTLSLTLVFLGFCMLMAGVLAICLRERRKIDGFGHSGFDDPRTIDHSLSHTVKQTASQATNQTADYSANRSATTIAFSGNGHDTFSALPASQTEDEAADKRVAIALFGSIIGGAILALITGYLVFFRDW